MEFDLFTLLPLAAAVFVFWKLRSVLGSRDGALPPQPSMDNNEPAAPYEGADNVVRLPGIDEKDAEIARKKAVADAIAKHGGDDEDLKDGLKAIIKQESTFDPDEFLTGSKAAYEMIVTAFADGDKDMLESLLADDVYENFASAIDERQERGEIMQSSFVGIEKAELSGAEMVRDEAHVTVSFVSQIISVTMDAAGEVVDGDENEVAEVNDVWTFARSVTSRDPNWKLIATDA